MTLADKVRVRQALSPADHVLHLTALRLRTDGRLIAKVGARIWLPEEVKPHPAWPLVIISDIRTSADGARLTIEVWSRFPGEAGDVADCVAGALPSPKFQQRDRKVIRLAESRCIVATINFEVEA